MVKFKKWVVDKLSVPLRFAMGPLPKCIEQRVQAVSHPNRCIDSHARHNSAAMKPRSTRRSRSPLLKSQKRLRVVAGAAGVACIALLFLVSVGLHSNLPPPIDDAQRKEMVQSLRKVTHDATRQAASFGVGSKSIKKMVRDDVQGALDSLPRPTQREHFQDNGHTSDPDRLRSALEPLWWDLPLPPQQDLEYDIHNCPDQPPPGYPYEWNALTVLDNWGVDDTSLPSNHIHQGLCVFDWRIDQAKVQAYRSAEVPFVLQQHPDVMATAERWSTPGYLEELLGSTEQRNEHAFTNHFMFWRRANRTPKGWKPPTDTVKLSYPQWVERAKEVQKDPATDRERWYFRINGNIEAREPVNTFLYDELAFFVPLDPSLFMVEPDKQRGINCRFGMKGVFAETHFDPTRNWVMVFGGHRRYILSHPRECSNLQLYPLGHPSGRHGSINWSNPRADPNLKEFANARMNEVVLQAGDALYLPTSWFHAIISLDMNYQCNARSGVTYEYMKDLERCGFSEIAEMELRSLQKHLKSL